VSIVVPAFNMEAYLGECLQSLSKQILADIEIIVVNDGSTDGTRGIIAAFVRADTRFICIDLPQNLGTFRARLEGIKATSGSYLCTVDADDWVSEDFANRLYRIAEDSGADVVECALHYVRKERSKIKLKWAETSPASAQGNDIVKGVLERKIWHIAANKIFRMSLVKTALPFLDKIQDKLVVADDKLLTFPFFYCAKSFVHIPDRLYFYRMRHDSATNHRVIENDIRHIKNTQLIDKYIEEYLNNVRADDWLYKLARLNRREEILIALRNILIYESGSNERQRLCAELLRNYDSESLEVLLEAHEYVATVSNAGLARYSRSDLMKIILHSIYRSLKAARVIIFPPCSIKKLNEESSR